jgi:hypothetical protein
VTCHLPNVRHGGHPPHSVDDSVDDAADPSAVHSMTDVLAHCGPDADGFQVTRFGR